MKLLIVTQAVDADSSTMGFFVEWLRAFARHCDQVAVIGLSVGRHDLPGNVRVLSMGKELGIGRFARLVNYWKHLFRELRNVDGVFIHMCPEYLIAGWPFFAAARKPVMLWYAHRQVSLRVRLGVAMADTIGTIHTGSFPIPSKKMRIYGHGIPTEQFVPGSDRVPGKLVAVGRISPIKRIDRLIDALALLRAKGHDVVLDLWGEPIVSGDEEYRELLVRSVMERGLGTYVNFKGAAPYSSMPKIYGAAAVALNACPDGALDKAVLEAMSCGTPVVVTNRNFFDLLGDDASVCLSKDDAESIADRIAALLATPLEALGDRLRAAVVKSHSLSRLTDRLLEFFKEFGQDRAV